MTAKTYLVQCWNKEGGLANHYEVLLSGEADRRELKKFLRSKYPQVLVTLQPQTKEAKRGR